VLGIVLGFYIGFPQLSQLRFITHARFCWYAPSPILVFSGFLRVSEWLFGPQPAPGSASAELWYSEAMNFPDAEPGTRGTQRKNLPTTNADARCRHERPDNPPSSRASMDAGCLNSPVVPPQLESPGRRSGGVVMSLTNRPNRTLQTIRKTMISHHTMSGRIGSPSMNLVSHPLVG
jgi:hypothetical protein